MLPSFETHHMYIFNPNFYFFDLKPHEKFPNPMITTSGRKVTAGESNKERKKQVGQSCAKLRLC
jgi:hypothetical protein